MRSPRLRKTDSTRFSQGQIPAFDVSLVYVWVGMWDGMKQEGDHRKGKRSFEEGVWEGNGKRTVGVERAS